MTAKVILNHGVKFGSLILVSDYSHVKSIAMKIVILRIIARFAKITTVIVYYSNTLKKNAEIIFARKFECSIGRR